MNSSNEHDAASIRSAVADRYSAIGVSPSNEGTIPSGRAWAERLGYPPALLNRVPVGAVESFTGIGSPVFAADIVPGERALDLGCGAGLDTILMAEMVSPRGQVYGVDLAHGMISTARTAVANVKLTNVSILQAPVEELPLPDQSVDLVLVNGLFNLVPDKRPVISEGARVIRPGGRLVGAEIVLADDRTPQDFDPESWFR